MPVIFVVFGVMLGSCGLGLTGMGAWMALSGSVGPEGLGMACGLLVTYGAYLFGRAAVRTRRELTAHPPTPKERTARRSAVRHIVGFSICVVVVSTAAPVPAFLRMVGVVTVVLVVPLFLAVEFEPPKNRPPGSG